MLIVILIALIVLIIGIAMTVYGFYRLNKSYSNYEDMQHADRLAASGLVAVAVGFLVLSVTGIQWILGVITWP